MTPKISIIVPLYNDVSNIARCLEYIVGQTIADVLELVIVDDCSTDNSVEVAQQFLEQHDFLGRAQIIKLEKNQGVANARKVGVLATTGDYILYCDSDDYMDNDMCESLLRKAGENDYDLVICDYRSIYGDFCKVITNSYSNDFLKDLIACNINGHLWNKLIKSNLIKNKDFLFPKDNFSEDYVYCLQFAIHAKKIGYVNRPLYNYIHRPGSIVMSLTEDNSKVYEADLNNFKLDMDILSSNHLIDKYRQEIIAHKLAVKNFYKNNIKLWRATFPELWKEIFLSRYVSLRAIVAYFNRLTGLYKIREVLGI